MSLVLSLGSLRTPAPRRQELCRHCDCSSIERALYVIVPGTLLKTKNAILWDREHVVLLIGKERHRKTHQEGYSI